MTDSAMNPRAATSARAEDPADEREQAVLLKAVGRASRVMLESMLCLALVMALLGNWLVPAALFVIILASGRVMEGYGHRRQVDIGWLADRFGPMVRSARGAVVLAGVVLTLAAMSYTGFMGHGLLTAPGIVATGPDAPPLLRSASGSMPIGAAVGLLISEAIAAVRHRRGPRPRPQASSAEGQE